MTDITLEYANCLDDRVGDQGLSRTAIEDAASELSAIAADLEESRGTGWERWRLLPEDPLRHAHVAQVSDLVDRYRGDVDNLVVLGIGGSALGTIALHSALNPLTYNLLPPEQRPGPRLFVLDNVDPHLVAQTLAEIRRVDPHGRRTLVNVISKSGETAETAAQFMVVRSMLEASLGRDYGQRIVATTDPEKGTLRTIAQREGFATLPIPEGVGGRFSVLSPVGLFSAAMCGIDIDALLDGAAAMEQRCRGGDGTSNPAALLAWLLVTHARRGRANHVLMPYANQLIAAADWFRQLWAESLGKLHDRRGREVFAGATPIRALGATDQHSQIQLYREGPRDKVIGFIEVEHFDEDVPIPADLDVDALRYLHGGSLGALLAAEKRATEYALVESRRPNYTLRLPALEPHAVGQFLQLWMITTAFAGRLFDIDAYDQPAVETGKVATFGLMGRQGYEQWKDKVEATLGSVLSLES